MTGELNDPHSRLRCGLKFLIWAIVILFVLRDLGAGLTNQPTERFHANFSSIAKTAANIFQVVAIGASDFGIALAFLFLLFPIRGTGILVIGFATFEFLWGRFIGPIRGAGIERWPWMTFFIAFRVLLIPLLSRGGRLIREAALDDLNRVRSRVALYLKFLIVVLVCMDLNHLETYTNAFTSLDNGSHHHDLAYCVRCLDRPLLIGLLTTCLGLAVRLRYFEIAGLGHALVGAGLFLKNLVPPTSDYWFRSVFFLLIFMATISFSVIGWLRLANTMEEKSEDLLTPADKLRRAISLQRPKPVMIWLFLTINAVVFALMALSSPNPSNFGHELLRSWGAADFALIFHGQVWRMLTANFIHHFPAHLANNVAGLILAGVMAEIFFGRFGFAFFYLMSGILGQIEGSDWLYDRIGCGASLSLVGLSGACLSLFIRNARRLRLTEFACAYPLSLVASWYILTHPIWIISQHYAEHNSHLMGWLVGLIFGLFLCPLYRSGKFVVRRRRWPIAFFASISYFFVAFTTGIANNADFAMNMRHYAKARDLFSIRILRNDKWAPNFDKRAWCELELKEYNAARLDIEEALRLNPDNPSALTTRASIRYKLKNYSGVISDCESVSSHDPKYSYAYLLRGLAVAKTNDYESAIKDFDHAAALNLRDFHNSFLCLESRGDCHWFLGNHWKGLSDYLQALQMCREKEKKELQSRKTARVSHGTKRKQTATTNPSGIGESDQKKLLGKVCAKISEMAWRASMGNAD